MFRFHHYHTPISSQTLYLVGVPPWLNTLFLLLYIYTLSCAFTQRIFFCDSDHTANTHAPQLWHSVWITIVLDRHSDRRELAMYYAFELRSWVIHSTPSDISFFTCTRSVRPVVGCITKWFTCRSRSDHLLHSSRTEFAWGCAGGPIARDFLLFSCAKLCKITFYALFCSILHKFTLFRSWRP